MILKMILKMRRLAIMLMPRSKILASWLVFSAALILLLGLFYFHDGGAPFSSKRVLRVAAASDMRFVMAKLISEFGLKNGDVRIEMTFGSSGLLAHQIDQGAPFDVFLSADQDLIQGLAARGKINGPYFQYALGRVVGWIANACLPQPRSQLSLQTFTQPCFHRIAMANPAHAPYGRAAEAALKKAGLATSLRPRLVIADSVSQAAQYAQAGSVEAALIAKSLALTSALQAAGKVFLLSDEEADPLPQTGAILRHDRADDIHDRDAAAFRDFILGEIGQSLLMKAGYERGSGKSALKTPRVANGF
jgi:molybdate transport system substrate-binding protein